MTDQTTPQTISAALKDAIREAGGIVHGDGNIFFTNAEQFTKAALAASAPVAPTPPDWRELCRRLYVELFHCDKQMTCSLNEDGEPIWRTGPEVRDVLSDAKAALEANPITPEAAPVAPAPMHAVPNLTLEPEMRAAMQAVFDAESVPVRPAPLTDTFVQTVPDKCDRIVWRNSYYHLPIAAAPKSDHVTDAGQKVPAAPQQGEYLPLPKPVARIDCSDSSDGHMRWWGELVEDTSHTSVHIGQRLFTEQQVREAIDAHRAAQASSPSDAEQAAWHAGPDEGRSQVRAPLQQGEHLPLPIGEGTVYCNPDGSLMIDASLAFFDGAKIGDKLYTADQVCAAIDADRAARGAAQAAPAEIDAKSFQSYAETRAYSKGYYAGKKAAQAAPDVVEELIRERDHRDEIIDALCDAVLEDRPEWSSSYYFEDAVVAVQERIAELEARNECRDLNAQAAPAPVAEDAAYTELHGQINYIAAYSVDALDALDRDRLLGFARSLVWRAQTSLEIANLARAQAAQPEGGAA